MSFIHFFTLGFRENFLLHGIILGIVIGIYTFFRLSKLFSYYNLDKKVSIIARTVIAIFFFFCCFNVQSTATILIAYAFGSSVVADIIGITYKLISKKGLKIHKNGILCLIFFILIMGVSIYGMNHIEPTEYNITTNKTNESYTILYISDIHYDTIQNPILMKNKLSAMNKTHPDLIILGGDITDERTSKSSMEEVYRELGSLSSTYGTFFIFGNHDRQPKIADYENGTKSYSNDELTAVIEENGIKILADDKITVNKDIILIGREDAGHGNTNNRLSSLELLNNTDSKSFIILLDHQPLDEKNNSENGVDLLISGHTHGGQIFPYGLVKEIQGQYNYGKYKIGNMIEIVSSGLCGWGIPLRNEARCEYVIINVN